ncbi:MAG: ABC-2 transporter permease [Peptococcaceae bacterium]|nr:ABC-2 transporter permease [Peptococcaceae bacterium]
MKGLLLKDFYLVRAALVIILVTYAVIGVGMSIIVDPWVTVVIGAVMFGIMSASTITMDKQYGWRKLAATLPVSKETSVDGKYLLYLMFSVLGFVVGVGISLVICAVKPELMPSGETIRLYLSVAAAMAFFSGGVMIPGNFLLSAEKAMITLIIAYPLITGIFVAVSRLTEDVMLTCNITMAIGVAVFAISWLVGRKVIAARDIQ